MTKKPKPDKQLAQVLAAIRDRVGPGRSPLYRWMRQRHAGLVTAFEETRPAWGAFAEEVAALGITDADGKAPTALGARQTWYRVRRDVAARAVKRAQVAPVLTSSEIAPGVRELAALPEPQTAGTPIKFAIRPARPRDAAGSDPAPLLPAGTAAGAPARPVGMPGQDAGVQDQMRRISEAMDVGKTPMPTVTR